MGGYGRGELAPFGEPIAKAFVDEAMNEARKLENQLRTLRTDRSVAVLHYSPIVDTIEGEPPSDLPISGLAAPVRTDRPLRPCEGGRPRPRPPRHIRRPDAARNAGLQCRAVRAEAAVRTALRGARNLGARASFRGFRRSASARRWSGGRRRRGGRWSASHRPSAGSGSRPGRRPRGRRRASRACRRRGSPPAPWWRMIGAASSEPDTPWLEMVKLPPETSARSSLPSRARRVRSSSLAPICFEAERCRRP